MTENPVEIPQAMCEQAEQNMKQAHAAYEQLTDFVTKAMDAWMGAMPSPMTAGFKDVRGRAMDIAMEISGVHVRRQDQQRTDLPRYCDASDAVCSRPDAGLRHADAAALQADRGNCPEAATRLIRQARKKAAQRLGAPARS